MGEGDKRMTNCEAELILEDTGCYPITRLHRAQPVAAIDKRSSRLEAAAAVAVAWSTCCKKCRKAFCYAGTPYISETVDVAVVGCPSPRFRKASRARSYWHVRKAMTLSSTTKEWCMTSEN